MSLKISFKLFLFFILLFFATNTFAQTKKVAYIVSDVSIPFWQIMAKGIEKKALELNYKVEVYNSNNLKSKELENTAKALNSDIDALIISPINSSTASTIISLAKRKDIPVVVADIGSKNKNYLSYISSNNEKGAYEIGLILAKKMKSLNLDKDASVGIVSIPQKRANGKARTKGFLKALDEYNIKTAGLLQQVDFSLEETYNHTNTLIKNNPNLKAIWLQGSDKYQGALNAIKDNNKENEILLICFDAEPEFLEMIPKEELVGAAMQQPFLIGAKALESVDLHLNGKKVKKEQMLDILAISKKNIEKLLPLIKRNVLGLEE